MNSLKITKPKLLLIRSAFVLGFVSLVISGCSANSQTIRNDADPISSLGPTPQTPISSTRVPAGTMALIDYPPLIMHYDPTSWIDRSQYTDLKTRVNFLDAVGLETCILGVQGPSGFFPSPDEIYTLGNVRYQFSMFEDQPAGSITAYYIEDESLAGYDYNIGLPVLSIRASPSEFQDCRIRAEEVLSTLQAPSG
jgi:hypothetical protein